MTIRIGPQHLVEPVMVAVWLGLLVADRLASGSVLTVAAPALAPAPIALLALLLFLAVRLNQALPVCLGLSAAAIAYLPAWGFDPGVLGAACCLALLACFAMGESGLADLRTLVQGSLVLLLPGLALLLGRLPAVVRVANTTILELPRGLSTPQPAFALLLLCGAAMAARMRGGSGFFSYAALWSLAPLAAALGAPSAAARRLGLLVALVIALHGVYRLYWQRVYLDELTGIQGRRAFEESFRRLYGSYAVAMLDIDHFKSFNDTWGHPEGDNVLRWVARHIRSALGSNRGLGAFRYGGEEFALLFRGPAVTKASEISEALRLSIASAPFSIRASPRPADAEPGVERRGRRRRGKPARRAEKVSVTVSMGVAWSGPALRRAKDVLQEADQALYRAKEEGRNRVSVAGTGAPPASHGENEPSTDSPR